MDTVYPPPKMGKDLSLKVYIINWLQWSSRNFHNLRHCTFVSRTTNHGNWTCCLCYIRYSDFCILCKDEKL